MQTMADSMTWYHSHALEIISDDTTWTLRTLISLKIKNMAYYTSAALAKAGVTSARRISLPICKNRISGLSSFQPKILWEINEQTLTHETKTSLSIQLSQPLLLHNSIESIRRKLIRNELVSVQIVTLELIIQNSNHYPSGLLP